jgi:uncharacterized repeat protein (TIGR03806 family)
MYTSKLLAGFTAVLFAVSCFVSRAANIALTNTDAINTTSFNAGLNWANGVAPTPGNNYLTAGFRLRTPANTTPITFAGDSLEIQGGGGELRLKTGAAVTINNLILDNGAAVTLTSPSGGTTGALMGNITLNGTSSLLSGLSTDANGGTTHVLTVGSVMSGTGGFNTTGSSGTIIFTATNTFSGATAISGGTVLVNGVVGSGTVTISSGMLGGRGVIRGSVTDQANGTLRPGLGGTDTSTLTISNNLNLGGTTIMTLNRNNAQNASKINGIATFTQGGALIVTNAGPALQAGDAFVLFSAATYANSFNTVSLPALTGNLIWSNSLSINGTLTITTTTFPVITNLPASQVLSTSANLNGQIISSGVSTPSVTLYYGTSDGGTNAVAWSNNVSLGPTTGSFGVPVSGLATNTVYYFTAFASNSAGGVWATPSKTFTTLAANPTAARVQVLTYHYDNTRQGANTNETLLTLANVNTNAFGKLFSYAVDGYVYTEPLIMTNVTIPGLGVHDVVIIATEHGTVYAFDANDNSGANGGLLWKTNLGIAHLSALAELGNRYNAGGCNCMTDIVPEIGVTGTPVIDPTTGTLYVNMFTRETTASATNYIHRIHAIDVRTGNERPYSPVVVAGSVPGRGTDSVGGVMTFNAKYANQRPALCLANGMLFVAYAGYADTDPYHGWLFAYNATNLSFTTNYIFNTTPNASTSAFGSHAAEGGIWMGGGGICVDSNNNLYFETGNGSFSANTNGGDYADSFMKISTTNGFAIADYFTPFDQASLASADTDLGSCGSVLLPDSVGSIAHPHLLVGMGKSGKVYLIDRDTMTTGNIHYQAGSDSEIVQSFGAVGGTWSPPSYWNGFVYCQPSSGAMKSFSIANGAINTTATATAPVSVGSYNGNAVISANGAGNGIVWLINGNSGNSGSAGTLYALNAANISQLLWSSAQLASRDSMGPAIKMTTPTVAGGRVYVPGQYTLSVYGLASFLSAPIIAPAGGVFTNSIVVTISNTAPGATVYYTLDGTTPTTSSTLYTGPFIITASTTVKAVAAQSGYVNSAVTSASFVNSLNLPPPPWQTSDIGAVAAAGSAFFSNGVFIVSGSGADIWNTADEFRFVYQPMTNGSDISARVTSQGNTDPWAKAAVMIRDSLAANSAYGLMAITPGNGFSFQYRSSAGITSDGNIAGGALNAAPNNWVRLTRTNNIFTAYKSADGVNWTQVGSPTTLSLNNAVYYVGLAVSAHNDGVISTATFDNVTVNGFSYNNSPPSVVLTAPSNNSTYTAAASVTITADADALYDAIARVDFYANAAFIGSASNLPYSVTTSGLGAGSYTLTAAAISSSGLSATSAPVNIIVTSGSGQPYGLTSRGIAPAFYNMPGTFAGSLPALLSQTGVFSNTPGMSPMNGLIPYAPNTPLWSDGALKTRYVSTPNNSGAITPDQQIAFAPTGSWTFPAGTVFVKTFELNTDTTNPNVRHRLETRLLVRDLNGAVYGVTYKWRADNSDADLLSSSLLENLVITNAGGLSTQTWYYPSPSDCLQCHTPVANYVLGLNTRQLNGNQTYPTSGVTDNQLRTMNRLGLFNPAFDESQISTFKKLSSLTNLSASLEERSRSYLDANCAQCHQPGGTGITFDARYDTLLQNQHITNYPASYSLGFDNARVIASKDIWRSMIWQRMNSTNPTIKMPPLARNLVDTNAVQVFTDWINSLDGTPALAPPTIMPNGGLFYNNVDLTLQAPDGSAAIYFTLDGTLPTTNSLLYSSVFNLTSNATVSASAFRTGYVNSVAASALFFVQPVQFTSQGFSNGTFWMQFLGAPGSNYILLASTNLANWSPLVTNPATTNLLNFIDPSSSNFPNRFYRVLQQ